MYSTQFAVAICFRSIARRAAHSRCAVIAISIDGGCAVIAVSIDAGRSAAFPAAWLTHWARGFLGFHLELAGRRRRAAGGAMLRTWRMRRACRSWSTWSTWTTWRRWMRWRRGRRAHFISTVCAVFGKTCAVFFVCGVFRIVLAANFCATFCGCGSPPQRRRLRSTFARRSPPAAGLIAPIFIKRIRLTLARRMQRGNGVSARLRRSGSFTAILNLVRASKHLQLFFCRASVLRFGQAPMLQCCALVMLPCSRTPVLRTPAICSVAVLPPAKSLRVELLPCSRLVPPGSAGFRVFACLRVAACSLMLSLLLQHILLPVLSNTGTVPA